MHNPGVHSTNFEHSGTASHKFCSGHFCNSQRHKNIALELWIWMQPDWHVGRQYRHAGILPWRLALKHIQLAVLVLPWCLPPANDHSNVMANTWCCSVGIINWAWSEQQIWEKEWPTHICSSFIAVAHKVGSRRSALWSLCMDSRRWKNSCWAFWARSSYGQGIQLRKYERNQPRRSVHCPRRLQGPPNQLLKGYNSINLFRLHHARQCYNFTQDNVSIRLRDWS